MKICVVFDVDGILVVNKGPMDASVSQSLDRFGANGGKLIVITGAPLKHIPRELFSFSGATLLAEHGAVQWRDRETTVLGEAEAIDKIKKGMGITVQDGVQKIDGGTIIVEGPRLASLTLLFGRPPHYPSGEATANPKVITARIKEIIERENLPVSVWPGHDGSYSYLDLIITTKRKTIQRLIKNGTLSTPFPYLGDKENDLEVMRLKGVIPVAFPNCIGEIISLAAQKGKNGIYIPYLPYKEGIPKFLELVKNGKL